MNIEKFKKQINIITSSKYHDGNFGHIVNINLISEFFSENKELADYIHFLEKFGAGELDASFCLDEEPVIWSEIFPKERSHLEGLYIFASDLSEYSFAFDSKNNYKVMEIAADGELSESNLGDFKEFINKQLDDLVEIVQWRDDNL